MESGGAVEAILCFDANLSCMDRCGLNCDVVEEVLCPHRFNVKAQIIYCNKPRFKDWPDSEILLFFIEGIKSKISSGEVNCNCVFMIVTRDHNFLDDAKREIGKTRSDELGLQFESDNVICKDFRVFVGTVKVILKKGRKNQDLPVVIQLVNNFILRRLRA